MASFAKVGKRYQCSEKSHKIDLRVKIKHSSKLKRAYGGNKIERNRITLQYLQLKDPLQPDLNNYMNKI